MTRLMLLLLLLAGCAPRQPLQIAKRPETQRWAAVLVAGDGSIPVFDNATSGMADILRAVGTPASDIHRFSDAPDELARPHIQLATSARVLDAIASLHPLPGQACFVFMTSHGAPQDGFYLAARDEFITPAALDEALTAGCGSAPTVAVVSACYSGSFAAPPMTRPNRIILTAAAADRSSFGCGAGQQFAFYDQCLLRTLQGLPANWPDVVAHTDGCVKELEAKDHAKPSLPQSAIGASAATLPVPG